MTTAVFFHAHPDDEVLFTGGTIARAAAEGHRVVLVTATRGERGADRAGVLADGQSMAEVRERELRAAAERLNIDRCVLLDYRDSGIDGEGPDGFCQAPAEEAARQLADILADEQAEVFVTYDERGIYGHPDHIQVHKVGIRAAQLADVESVFLATVDRDRLQAMLKAAQAFGLELDDQTLDWAVTAGVSSDRITTTVDVGGYMAAKRDAMAAHRTQFPPRSTVLELPPPAFQFVFGTEWFIQLDSPEQGSWLWDS